MNNKLYEMLHKKNVATKWGTTGTTQNLIPPHQDWMKTDALTQYYSTFPCRSTVFIIHRNLSTMVSFSLYFYC